MDSFLTILNLAIVFYGIWISNNHFIIVRMPCEAIPRCIERESGTEWRSLVHSNCWSLLRGKVKLMNICFWKTRPWLIIHQPHWKHPHMSDDLMLPWQPQKYWGGRDICTHALSHTHIQRQTDVQAFSRMSPMCVWEERRILYAKYKNRIMRIHPFYISSAFSLLFSLSSLNGPNISPGPLSFIKERYNTRILKLFWHWQPRKTNLDSYQPDIGQFPHLKHRILCLSESASSWIQISTKSAQVTNIKHTNLEL